MMKTSSLILESPIKKISKQIDAEVLALLNQGRVEARNLMEGLKVDFTQLIKPLLKKPLAKAELDQLCLPYGIVQRMKTAASILNQQQIDFNLLIDHRSDTVRGWAAYQIANLLDLSLAERLELIKPLADDSHFGVREWAWLALRPFCLSRLSNMLELLQPWIRESSANLRRFACEITRPRGVWCTHIPDLKTNPNQALPLLKPLRQDNSRYVQNSLANWLNDASKTNKEWVVNLCQEWLQESTSPATAYICRRAQRSFGKK
jgi:3-methyladenine DNA glycosylase AlkC